MHRERTALDNYNIGDVNGVLAHYGERAERFGASSIDAGRYELKITRNEPRGQHERVRTKSLYVWPPSEFSSELRADQLDRITSSSDGRLDENNRGGRPLNLPRRKVRVANFAQGRATIRVVAASNSRVIGRRSERERSIARAKLTSRY